MPEVGAIRGRTGCRRREQVQGKQQQEEEFHCGKAEVFDAEGRQKNRGVPQAT